MDGDSEDEEFYDASDHPSIVLTSSETQLFYRHDLQNLGKEFDSSCVLNDFEAKDEIDGGSQLEVAPGEEKHCLKSNDVKNCENKVEIGIDQNFHESLNIAPVAPPRRKKKHKKEAEITKVSENSESFVSAGAVEQVKSLQQSVDFQTKALSSVDKSNSECDDEIESHLDISTQEMSEILDRNNSTEVITPLYLQRNKSQSISSIGSFCSVSSNISFQERSKRSGSQASLGSNTDKITTASTALTDQEILEAVVVRNLDTGETMPLSEAEKSLPSGVNPLALHIMRLTTEFSSQKDLVASDQEDVGDDNVTTRKILRKKKNLRGLFARKIKSKDQKVKGGKDGKRGMDESSSSDEENPQSENYIKVKSANGKGQSIINKLNIIQDLSGKHQGAVWTMKFSSCGKLLGTAGQDKVVHVWVLKTEKDFFEQMRNKYAKADSERTESQEKSLNVGNEKDSKDVVIEQDDYPEGFYKAPFCSYEGHGSDVLDLSWSKNYFLLSSSMDKTVRLWHISRTECLCCFQHIDFVTAIIFHPRDDRYFLSGSLDGKIRLWNIPDKKVALWNELEGAGSHLITAANFCMNGRFAVVGTYDGRCIFYETEHLKYYTQWQIRSSRKKQGRKISGIEPMPGEDKILITSNDSRIRLYNLKTHTLDCKYKGFTNSSSQIKGSFSHDSELVVCGSEDHYVYIWRANHRISTARKDRNDFYEGFSAHNAVVTAAIFAPCPWNVVQTEYNDNSTGMTGPEVIVTADWTGAIKIFLNK
ncbi:WD repeat-containing protein 44-like isoform X2 [Xenia sp. Carnegie-2017]|uniref:WD repeat-containing protein 44-like isoform X2 n=1 Tax=Xenia sp. Carnegie-2017 TaxID=2897299 RepID=UPI001F04863C|nr:WD repeat-containing protein 44-like isoform X2 [Xenia sp. Carnegie-2017]